mgnify:CR=1 FL=1
MNVFNLPRLSAARVFPFPAATRHRPVMSNSLDKMRRIGNKAHLSSSPNDNKLTNIPKVRTLSESASINFPNSETCPNFLANQPSNQSVNAANKKTSRARVRVHEKLFSASGYNNPITKSMSGIRERVSRLGRFILRKTTHTFASPYWQSIRQQCLRMDFDQMHGILFIYDQGFVPRNF